MTVDLSGIAKWPNVPACYDWLSLDRRGDWRLQGERVTHSGLINFMHQQYGCDESGCWFVQNGPQRVFVRLACTPWIFRFNATPERELVSQTGQAAGAIKAIYLDADGNILFDTELGIGLLDDRDLATFIGQCCDIHGRPAEENAFFGLMQGRSTRIDWQGLTLGKIAAVDLPKRFKFNPQPHPA